MNVINAIILRHQSSCKTSPSNAKRKAKAISFEATSGLANERNKNIVRASWVSQQNSLHDNNYHRRCVNCHETSATNTVMKPGDPLNGKHQADQANSCPWSHTTQASGSTKKAKTSAAAMTRGMHVTRATLAAWTARASRLAVPGTPSPTKQSKREGRQQQIPSWWIPHKKTNVDCDVVLLSLSCKSSPTKHSEKKSDVDLDWDDAFKDAILPILRLHLMQTSKTGFELKKPVLSTRVTENLGKYNSTDFKMHSTKKLGIPNSNQLSGIENLDASSPNPTVFFTGNAPKNLHVNNVTWLKLLIADTF
jgi:hypothetical protein